MLISLDVKNEFNNAFQTDVLRLMAEYSVLLDLLSLIYCFVWNSSIISDANEHYFNVSVPQGSCLVPNLWLVLINSSLKWLELDEAWTILVFTGDIFILAISPTVYGFVDIVRRDLTDSRLADRMYNSRNKEIYT